MIIGAGFKPLYANLKRLNIGSYLQSTNFNHFIIENNFDRKWKKLVEEAEKLYPPNSDGSPSTDALEEALMYMIEWWYYHLIHSVASNFPPLLVDFNKWSSDVLDCSKVYDNLKELNVSIKVRNELKRDIDALQAEKPFSDSVPTREQQFVAKINTGVNSGAGGKSKIFIVHGHNDSVKNEVARFLTQLGLTPIIIHEQVGTGQTIIEQIEKYGDVGFGVVLYTECDEGHVKGKPEAKKFRARQNVIFEHGYLIARIGRKNVCAMIHGEVETPSDISGMLYHQFDKNGGWKFKLSQGLASSGYQIDLNLAIAI